MKKDPGFKGGKRGLKAGALTIRAWKRVNRNKHLGGTNRPTWGVKWWARQVDGKWRGTYQKGFAVEILPGILGRPPK